MSSGSCRRANSPRRTKDGRFSRTIAASLWDARPDVVRSRRAVDPPICLECGQTAALTTSQKIYPRRPDLWNRPMWLCACGAYTARSEEHTSELQSLMRISYAVFCLKKKKKH